MLHDPRGLSKSLRTLAEASTALRPSLLSVSAGSAYSGSLLSLKQSLQTADRDDAMRKFFDCHHVFLAAADLLEHFATGGG